MIFFKGSNLSSEGCFSKAKLLLIVALKLMLLIPEEILQCDNILQNLDVYSREISTHPTILNNSFKQVMPRLPIFSAGFEGSPES